jgi:PKD repeat protein
MVGNATGPDANYKAGYLKLAPDDKIYIAKWHSTYLATISAPDQAGTGCGFTDNGFYLGGKISQCGLCNVIVQRLSPDITAQGNCAGYTFALTDSVGISTVQWNFGDPASGPANTASTFLSSHQFSNSGTYTVQAIYVTACQFSDTLTYQVTVIPGSVTAGFSSVSGCTGTPVNFNNTSIGASTFQWDFGDNSVSTATSPSHVYAAPGTYTVVLTAGSVCGNDADSQTVVISQSPSISITGTDSICAGETVTLTATGGSSYQWSGGSSDTTAAITVSPTVTTVYNVISSNGTCSSPMSTFVVVVNPQPIVAISGSNHVCPGASTTLTATGASSFVWGGGASGTTPAVTVSPTGPTNYFVIGTNGNCSDTAAFTVLVYDVMTVAILGNDTICAGESTQLLSSGTGTFNWAPGSTLNTTTGSTVIATPSVTTTYSVTLSDIHGCVDSSSFPVYVEVCTGVNEASLTEGAVIYPNPGAGLFMIMKETTGSAVIEVFNVTGQLVYSETTSRSIYELDMQDQTEGVYFVKISSVSGSSVHKILIKR